MSSPKAIVPTRRRLIRQLGSLTLLLISSRSAPAIDSGAAPKITQVIGSSVLPAADSIVLVVGENLNLVQRAYLSTGHGEAEIVRRDSSYLALRINPRDSRLTGKVSLIFVVLNGATLSRTVSLYPDSTQQSGCSDFDPSRHST